MHGPDGLIGELYRMSNNCLPTKPVLYSPLQKNKTTIQQNLEGIPHKSDDSRTLTPKSDRNKQKTKTPHQTLELYVVIHAWNYNA